MLPICALSASYQWDLLLCNSSTRYMHANLHNARNYASCCYHKPIFSSFIQITLGSLGSAIHVGCCISSTMQSAEPIVNPHNFKVEDIVMQYKKPFDESALHRSSNVLGFPILISWNALTLMPVVCPHSHMYLLYAWCNDDVISLLKATSRIHVHVDVMI